jgi:putative CocE/NonD family hydrolase
MIDGFAAGWRRFLCSLIMVLAALGIQAGAAAAWRPGPARYGVYEERNLPVRMGDGTVLRANVYYPALGGHPARGPFPVLLTQTPYGKDIAGSASDVTGEAPYLIERGFIDVVADVRGTGDSGGQFGFFDPQQQSDGARLVHWAARLPHSDRRVGLYGASYLGINQLLTVGRLGRRSPVKAIFPIVSLQ